GIGGGGDEDVAGVGVCVEEPVGEELVEHGGGECFGDGGGVDSGGLEAVAVADFDGGDVGEGEYASGGAFPHDGGCTHGGVVGEVIGEPFGVGAFVQVVDFFETDGGE